MHWRHVLAQLWLNAVLTAAAHGRWEGAQLGGCMRESSPQL